MQVLSSAIELRADKRQDTPMYFVVATLPHCNVLQFCNVSLLTLFVIVPLLAGSGATPFLVLFVTDGFSATDKGFLCLINFALDLF